MEPKIFYTLPSMFAWTKMNTFCQTWDSRLNSQIPRLFCQSKYLPLSLPNKSCPNYLSHHKKNSKSRISICKTTSRCSFSSISNNSSSSNCNRLCNNSLRCTTLSWCKVKSTISRPESLKLSSITWPLIHPWFSSNSNSPRNNGITTLWSRQ